MKPEQIKIKGYDLISDEAIAVNFLTWDGGCLCSVQQHSKTFTTDTTKLYSVQAKGLKVVDIQALKNFIANEMKP